MPLDAAGRFRTEETVVRRPRLPVRMPWREVFPLSRRLTAFGRMLRAKQAIGKCLGFLCQGRRLDGFLLSEGQPIIGRCSPPGPPAIPGLQVSLFRADGLHPRTCNHPFSGAEFFRRLSVPGLCVFGRFFARMRPGFSFRQPPDRGPFSPLRSESLFPARRQVLSSVSFSPRKGPPGVDFAALFVPRDPEWTIPPAAPKAVRILNPSIRSGWSSFPSSFDPKTFIPSFRVENFRISISNRGDGLALLPGGRISPSGAPVENERGNRFFPHRRFAGDPRAGAGCFLSL